MKKILIYGAAVAAIAGCSAKEEQTNGVKVFNTSCEKVVVFDQGDMIVKCPTNETFASLQAQTPTGMFVQGGDFDYAAAAADTEHVYVNVIPAGSYEWAAQTEYRILVQNPNFDEGSLWTVSVIVEE